MASIKVPDLILSPLPTPGCLPSCIVVSISPLPTSRVPGFTFISYCESRPCFAFLLLLPHSLLLSLPRCLPCPTAVSRFRPLISPRSNHSIPFRESNGHNRLAVTSREKEGRSYCYFPFSGRRIGWSFHFTLIPRVSNSLLLTMYEVRKGSRSYHPVPMEIA